MKRTILIFLISLSFGKSLACLNGESKQLTDMEYLYIDDEGQIPYGHKFPSDDWLRDTKNRMEVLYKQTKNLDYLSDKGLLLILLKRYNEAIEIFLNIEKLEPNRYSTAVNIGTAYELIGQNYNALKWIKKCVTINSSSHKNSEWIHVKILEAKIKGEQCYTSVFLIKTDFGTDELPSTDLSYKQLFDLSSQLYYQINERASFVKPTEKIIGVLLFNLGNLEFLLKKYKRSRADYELAKTYGYQNKLINDREKLAINYSNGIIPESNLGLIIGVVFFSVVVSLVILIAKKIAN